MLAQLLIRLKDGAKKISAEIIKPHEQQVNSNVDKTDESEFNQLILHVWSSLYWLAGLICLMILVSMLISHHSDLRLQMTGARMRIACCSLIYRKVSQPLHSLKMFHLQFHVNDFHLFIF